MSVAARGAEACGAVGAAGTHAWRALRTDGEPGRTGSAGRGLCGTDQLPGSREHEPKPGAR